MINHWAVFWHLITHRYIIPRRVKDILWSVAVATRPKSTQHRVIFTSLNMNKCPLRACVHRAFCFVADERCQCLSSPWRRHLDNRRRMIHTAVHHLFVFYLTSSRQSKEDASAWHDPRKTKTWWKRAGGMFLRAENIHTSMFMFHWFVCVWGRL